MGAEYLLLFPFFFDLRPFRHIQWEQMQCWVPFFLDLSFFLSLGVGEVLKYCTLFFFANFVLFSIFHYALRITHYTVFFSAVIRPDLWWGQYHSNKEFFPVFLLVFILVAAVLF